MRRVGEWRLRRMKRDRPASAETHADHHPLVLRCAPDRRASKNTLADAARHRSWFQPAKSPHCLRSRDGFVTHRTDGEHPPRPDSDTVRSRHGPWLNVPPRGTLQGAVAASFSGCSRAAPKRYGGLTITPPCCIAGAGPAGSPALGQAAELPDRRRTAVEHRGGPDSDMLRSRDVRRLTRLHRPLRSGRAAPAA